MSSSVFFKFKSQKEPSRVTFDGTGISVFELKREIITINRLGDGTDFDLAVYNEDTNEEYGDDTTIIPRSTSITARRLPASRFGKGTASRYVSGKMPVNALSTSRLEKVTLKPNPQPSRPMASQAVTRTGPESEEDKIAAMFAANAQQWEQQQVDMANATPIHRPGAGRGKPGTMLAVPDHPPPTGYVCYRCGEKGHWIQQCPTNADPTFDNRPRVKRTTGIPRSFLKTVEKPPEDGMSADGVPAPSGIMVNAEGEYVVAEPDKASWEQYQAKAMLSDAARGQANSGSKDLQDLGLECPIDKKLFVDPVKTPCCETTYCSECITNALMESDFVCPGCETSGTLIDDLTPDEETATKIKDYLQAKENPITTSGPMIVAKEVMEDSREGGAESRSPSANSDHYSPTFEHVSPANSASAVNSKKRTASSDLRDLQPPNKTSKPTTPVPMENNSTAISTQPTQTNGFPVSVPIGPAALTANQTNTQMNGFANQGMMGMGNMMMPNMMMNPMAMPGMNMMGMSGMGGMGMPNFGFPQQSYPMNFAGGAWPNAYPNQNFGMMPMGGYNGAMAMPQMPAFTPQAPVQPPQGATPGQPPKVFNAGQQNGEDNAYFRPPVNPQRHQSRQRRARPSEYQELGQGP